MLKKFYSTEFERSYEVQSEAIEQLNFLIDAGPTKQNTSFVVPCLFTNFKPLFSNTSKLERNGDVFKKLKLAVDFNDKTGEKIDLATVHNVLQIPSQPQQKFRRRQKRQESQRRQFTIPSQQQPAMHKLKVTQFVQKLTNELKTFSTE